MAIFLFFQDGGRPPSCICNECVGTTHEGHLVVFITVQNLVGIDAVVLIICTFFDFASLAWKRLFIPQNWVFKGENRGRGGNWPPTNSFLLLGVYKFVSNLKKIDEEMRPWECPQTDTHTHTQTDAKRFYYLSHAICYSYGADNNFWRFKAHKCHDLINCFYQPQSTLLLLLLLCALRATWHQQSIYRYRQI